MTNLRLPLMILFMAHSALAIPRFAVKNGTTCSTCHVSPTGSGLRNYYGITIVSMDELPTIKGMRKTDESYTGEITDHLQLGADLRLQFLGYSQGDSLQKTAIFPMQVDVYGHFSISKAVDVYVEVDVLRGNSEIWTALNILPYEGYVKIGKKIPHYGLPLDDHTSFIRGGNLRRTHGLTKEGMPFEPLRGVPGMVEIGASVSDFFLTASISNGYILGTDQGYGFFESLSDKTLTGRVEYSTFLGSVSGLAGVSLLKEQDLSMGGIFGGLSLGPLTWSGEVDLAENWVGEGISLASYSEAVVEPVQGLHILAKFDFFDEDIAFTENAITRLTGGIEFFPYSFLEIKAQARFTKVAGAEDQSKPEYLLQFHTWF